METQHSGNRGPVWPKLGTRVHVQQRRSGSSLNPAISAISFVLDEEQALSTSITLVQKALSQQGKSFTPISTLAQPQMKRPRKGGKDGNNDQVTNPKPWGAYVPSAPVYEFERLANFDPDFRKYVKMHGNGTVSVDFSKRAATAALTTAILRQHFSLKFSLPTGHLVPTIPSRVQYLRWAVSLLPAHFTEGVHSVLDIGTGSSTIYTLLGARIFPLWHFVGTDTDASAIAVAKGIVSANILQDRIALVHTNAEEPLISPSYWGESDTIMPALTLCNPPFFDEVPETDDAAGVAAGVPAQLATEGGEVEFVKQIARASVNNPEIAVFTSLVGLKASLSRIKSYLEGDEIRAYQTVARKLKAGSRTARWAIAWSFGPRRSLVNVRGALETSNWRAAISVSPGRKFANRLTGADVITMCRSVLLDMNWTAAEETPDGDANSSETSMSVVKKVYDEEKGESQMSISCSEPDEVRRLNLLLKVEKRGAMRPFQVFRLAQKVAAEMKITMNMPQQ